ncbi:MAG: hypothetical protein NT062_14230 [Proteobacteria bacterium]|nr:hypothetical protein [Pseudomonadota bacterium]
MLRVDRGLALHVIGDEVGHDPDPARVGFADELVQLVGRAERGLDRVGVAEVIGGGVAGHDRVVAVIARVALRVGDGDAGLARVRVQHGRADPQGVDPHRREVAVLDLGRDAREVAALPLAADVGDPREVALRVVEVVRGLAVEKTIGHDLIQDRIAPREVGVRDARPDPHRDVERPLRVAADQVRVLARRDAGRDEGERLRGRIERRRRIDRRATQANLGLAEIELAGPAIRGDHHVGVDR